MMVDRSEIEKIKVENQAFRKQILESLSRLTNAIKPNPEEVTQILKDLSE
ncbi:MAG: hypothetical protein HZC29_04215 [Thaumarchaeota archaeon]|nr:hypothetical protein [Nitrososphaerota archaeon]